MPSLPDKVWINGRLADPRRPLLSAFDRGFLYGDGVYETLRVYAGRPAFFREHFARLRGSARGVSISLPLSSAALRKAVEKLIRANGLKEASVRITLSRGPGPLGFDPRLARTPTLLITPGPSPIHDPLLYEKGIRLAVARVRRHARTSLDPAFKTTNNLNNILAKQDAIRRGAYEALMLNADGHLAEGTISNIFFVGNKVLKTPSLDCGLLAGVTRDKVLRLARARGLKVAEGRYGLPDLLAADEAFLTSTTLETMPVAEVVDPAGRRHRLPPGPWARRLRADYLALVGKVAN